MTPGQFGDYQFANLLGKRLPGVTSCAQVTVAQPPDQPRVSGKRTPSWSFQNLVFCCSATILCDERLLHQACFLIVGCPVKQIMPMRS